MCMGMYLFSLCKCISMCSTLPTCSWVIYVHIKQENSWGMHIKALSAQKDGLLWWASTFSCFFLGEPKEEKVAWTEQVGFNAAPWPALHLRNFLSLASVSLFILMWLIALLCCFTIPVIFQTHSFCQPLAVRTIPVYHSHSCASSPALLARLCLPSTSFSHHTQRQRTCDPW